MCRLYSKELSTLKPQLDANSVCMVGIGVEELGVEDFVKGKYFNGDLYVDSSKKTFKAFNFKRINFFDGVGAVMGKKGRGIIDQAKKQGIKGNLKGDVFQNGGTIIIKPGGEILLNFKQQHPGDHVPLQDVLDALSISGVAPIANTAIPKQDVQCEDGACAME